MISSGFSPMRIELREAKILPNNKDCLQFFKKILLLLLSSLLLLLSKKYFEGNPCCLVRSLLTCCLCKCIGWWLDYDKYLNFWVAKKETTISLISTGFEGIAKLRLVTGWWLEYDNYHVDAVYGSVGCHPFQFIVHVLCLMGRGHFCA